MEMMTRTVALQGAPARTSAAAIAITEHVNQVTGRQVALWSSVSGGPAGTFTWALQVDGLADQMAMLRPLFEDEEYSRMVDEMADMRTGQAEDALYQPVNDLPPDGTRVGNVLAVAEFNAAPGRLGQAISSALDAAMTSEKLTPGSQTVVMSTATGSFSRVLAMTAFRDAAAADTARRTMLADDGYRESVAKVGQSAVPMSGRQSVHVRIA